MKVLLLMTLIPIGVIVYCGYLLNEGLLTKAECTLESKSYKDYNCSDQMIKDRGSTYPCISTIAYELIYMARIKGTQNIKQVRQKEGQQCFCHFASGDYVEFRVESTTLSTVDVTLDAFNNIGNEFTCYTDSVDIYLYTDYPTTQTVYITLGVSFIILISIILIRLFNKYRRPKYIPVPLSED